MKKKYVALPQVEELIEEQSVEVQLEYDEIVEKLERQGRLQSPFGEKVNSDLFAIRVVQAGNVRVFYVYGADDFVYGIYGYVKKTQKIPLKQMKQAERVVKKLKQRGVLK